MIWKKSLIYVQQHQDQDSKKSRKKVGRETEIPRRAEVLEHIKQINIKKTSETSSNDKNIICDDNIHKEELEEYVNNLIKDSALPNVND